MWTEFIRNHSSSCEFSSPASTDALKDAEVVLDVLFHNDLQCILTEPNGIQDEYGTEILWAVERIVESNIEFRTDSSFKSLYMPFDYFLFFGDSGNGDQFAYPIQNGKIHNDDIFIWNHENDSRNWIAPNLKTFFEWLLAGKLDA